MSEEWVHVGPLPGGGAWQSVGEWEFLARTHHEATVVRAVWDGNEYALRPFDVEHSGNVLDVGACFGAYTCLAVAAGAKKVVAVEPHDGNRLAWAFNLQHNKVRDDRVTLVPGAALDGSSVRVDGDSVHATTHRDLDGDTPSWSLESLIARHGLVNHRGEAEVDVLKIDCEGCEYPLLLNAERRTLDAVRRITMEWHGSADEEGRALAPDQQIAPAAIGALVTKLLDTHKVEVYGHPGRGGMLYADHY